MSDNNVVRPTTPPQRTAQRAPQRGQIIRTAENRYLVDQSKIPAGYSYEWKRVSVLGQPDEEHQINVSANGWTPVPADRHPELAGMKAVKDATLIRGGQMLMERPIELTQAARIEEKGRADDQIKTQLQRVGHESRERGYRQTKAAHGDFDTIPGEKL